MLKDYKVGKAYEYFSSGWLQEGYFLKAKSKNNNNLCIVAKLHTMIMFIKPTRINLKGVCNSTLSQNVVVASLVVLQNIIL
jgi:hypothetical protein